MTYADSELWVHTSLRGAVAGSEYIWVTWSITWGTARGVKRDKFQPGFLPLANWPLDSLDFGILICKMGMMSDVPANGIDERIRLHDPMKTRKVLLKT